MDLKGGLKENGKSLMSIRLLHGGSRFNILIVFAFIMVIIPEARANIRFTGNIDKTRISLDDYFTLVLKASGKEVNRNMAEPRIPKSIQFRLVDKKASISSSSSFRIIVNGKDMSREAEKKITWTYVFAPTAAGTFTLPPFVLEFKGEEYKTNPVQIKVTKEQVKTQDVIFKCIPQKRTVYLGEQFRFTVRIAIRHGANAYNPQRPRVEEVLRKYFWVEDIKKGEIKGIRKVINGIQYDVFDIPFALYPIQSGKITIPSMTLQYQQRQQARNRRSFFDDPFFNNFFGAGVRAVPKQKISRPVAINVLDIPGSPGNFSGSIGNFSLSARIDKTTLPAGDALTYTIILKGNSSLRNIKDPIVPDINGFDVFEPEKKTTTQITGNTVWGSRTYKYVMIPQRQGVFTIEPAKYVFFDVITKKFKTIKTAAFSVKVTPGKQRTAIVTTGHRLMSKQEIKQLGEDIRYIKTGNIEFSNSEEPLHRNILFLMLQIIPAIAVFFSFLYQKQRQRLIKDVGYARRTRSRKLVRKRLAEAKAFLRQNRTSDYYASLSKGILGYIGDILNVETFGMTTEAVKKLLLDAGQPQDLVDGVVSLIERLDFARFATTTVNVEEMNKDMKDAELLLSRFNVKK